MALADNVAEGANVMALADSLSCVAGQEVVEKERPSRLPLIMGGASMGGMITVLTVLRQQDKWKATHVPLALPCRERSPSIGDGALPLSQKSLRMRGSGFGVGLLLPLDNQVCCKQE
jgi:hypothetical protein